jgi:hypothetical protein
MFNNIKQFKMKKIYYLIIMILAGVWASSCTEDTIGQPSVDSVPPPPLTNVRVEPTPGGAIIRYDLPNVTDISYVRGEYWFQGAYKVTRASIMNNYMAIEGLGSIAPVEVTLYVVDHSENVSTPEKVSFSPSVPPIESIFKSLELVPDWGGVQIQWDNPTGAEIGFTVYAADSVGEFGDGITFFSSLTQGARPFREVPDLSERRFGVQLLDRWGNTTPVKEWLVVPKFEELIDRTKIKQFVIPWDNTSNNGGSQPFTKMFDGTKISNGNESWHTQENRSPTEFGFTHPVLFTVDLGSEVILSRFLWWQGRWADYFLYGHHNPRTFEVWGTTKAPDLNLPTEYWLQEWKQDWTLFAECTIVKPSNPLLTSADGQLTADDRAAADAGHEFYMPLTPVRYLRFSVTSTWIGNRDNTITIQEIEFYGDDGIDNN